MPSDPVIDRAGRACRPILANFFCAPENTPHIHVALPAKTGKCSASLLAPADPHVWPPQTRRTNGSQRMPSVSPDLLKGFSTGPDTLGDDLLWGMKKIAREIGLTERQAYHLASTGKIPVGKLGAAPRREPKGIARRVLEQSSLARVRERWCLKNGSRPLTGRTDFRTVSLWRRKLIGNIAKR